MADQTSIPGPTVKTAGDPEASDQTMVFPVPGTNALLIAPDQRHWKYSP
jgi:hypothetical protein